MQEKRANDPSLWRQCKSFSHFLSALILGKSCVMGPHAAIEHGHGNDATWDERVKKAEMRATKLADEYAKKQEQYYSEMEDSGDVDEKRDRHGIGSFQGFLITSSLKIFFGTLQQWLGFACTWLRVLKNIACWEECYISFWIAFMSFLFAAVALFVPWGFVLQWTSRIVAWVALGPWMKLVDVFYVSRATKETDEQKRVRQRRLEGQNLDAQVSGLCSQVKAHTVFVISNQSLCQIRLHEKRLPSLRISRSGCLGSILAA
jgi:hypothetical protein